MGNQMNLEECQEYWKNPSGRNKPNHYIQHIKRSVWLHENIFKKHSDTNDNILELGCNVGRNLNYLFHQGFKNLSGVEINSNAVLLLKDTYPEMARMTELYNSSIEDAVVKFNDEQFDHVFSMAVLEHIPYESDWIFKEISRISKKYVTVLELETVSSQHIFARNYKEIFESFGLTELEGPDQLGQCDGLGGYAVRIFNKKTK